MSNTFGYMRVSTLEQKADRQLIELLQFGIPRRSIYMDKQSGKDFDRPAYQRLRRKIREGDLVVFKSIDRLGRNYKDILTEWQYITKTKKADILILDMPLLDTRRDKDLVGTLISDIVLQLLSYVAEVERVNIRQRQAEGIAAARARGVHLGRRPNPIPEGFDSIYHLWLNKEISPPQAFQMSQMTPGQFYWTARKYRISLGSSTRSLEKA